MVGVSLNVFDVDPVYLYVDRQSYSERLQCGVIAVDHNHDHWQSISITHIIGPCRRNYDAQQALTLGLWMQWPGGPVDLKTYWPPQKLTGPPKTNWPLPQNQTCAMKKIFA